MCPPPDEPKRRVQFADIALEALAVEGVALGHVIVKDLRGPLPETGRADGVHSVAHGDHCVKAEVFNLPGDVAVAFELNCFQNGNSCRSIQLAAGENVLQVL